MGFVELREGAQKHWRGGLQKWGETSLPKILRGYRPTCTFLGGWEGNGWRWMTRKIGWGK